jgi:hypothetical protein
MEKNSDIDTNPDFAIPIQDEESGHVPGLRHRNGMLGGMFGKVTSLFFSSQDPNLDLEINSAEKLLQEHANYLIDGITCAFEPNFMNQALLPYMSDNLVDEISIKKWDRQALDDERLPSFRYSDSDETDFWVHPLSPKLSFDESFDINTFRGNETLVQFSCSIEGGWNLGKTKIWLSELKIIEIQSDVPNLSIEVQLKIGNQCNYQSCLITNDDIIGSGNLLKPKIAKSDETLVLKRNTIFGLYVSGKKKTDLEKYAKECGNNKDYVLIERTLTTMLLFETAKTSDFESREIENVLKKHDGQFFKIRKVLWEALIEDMDTHLAVSPIQEIELVFKLFDGRKWEAVTSAEKRQWLQMKFEVHPILHFGSDEERMSIIKKLIE